jgi:hypothetical protein
VNRDKIILVFFVDIGSLKIVNGTIMVAKPVPDGRHVLLSN